MEPLNNPPRFPNLAMEPCFFEGVGVRLLDSFGGLGLGVYLSVLTVWG